MSVQAEIDRILQQASESGAIPGAVAMAATRNEIIYQGAFGKRDAAKDTTMTPDSVFWIASMTKAITGAAAMQLVEQGKLTLDAPLGDRAAGPRARRRCWTASTAKALRNYVRPRHPITLAASADPHRRLSATTCGTATWCAISRQTGTPPFRSGLNAAMKVPIMRDPGTRWEYGTNLDFVGKAVEAASGERLDAYFREPFAGAAWDDRHRLRDWRRRSASAWLPCISRGADGALTPIPFEIKQDPEFFAGGGGLYGTAPDYIKFTQMILNNGTGNGNRMLKPETVALMSQNHIGELNMTPMTSAVPTASNNVDFLPGHRQEIRAQLHDQHGADSRKAAAPAALPGPASPTPITGSIRRAMSPASS
jgi:methyl acetate hydrolase